MPTEVTATEVAKNLTEYLNRVAYRGERFIIVRGKKPLAILAPVKPPVRGPGLLALFERLPKLSADELDAFERDIEDGRNARLPFAGASQWDP